MGEAFRVVLLVGLVAALLTTGALGLSWWMQPERRLRREQGALTHERAYETAQGPRAFAVGDRLVFLENSSPESIVIAATNHRSILDKALFRRFDMVLNYSLPDAKQAAAVMRGRLGSLAKGVRWAALAEHMAGLSHADLVRAAESAAKSVILAGGTRVSADDIRQSLKTRQAASLG